jgi:hypothetical protein
VDTWLVIHTAAGAVHAWNLGDADLETREHATWAARAQLAFVADDSWVTSEDPSSVAITFGQPHHTLMAVAQVGTLADLQAVKPAVVAAYRDEYAKTQRATAIESAHRMLAGLDDEARAEVHRRLSS